METIEKNPEATLFHEIFYPCRTIELEAQDGKKRLFVEYSEATDYGADIVFNENVPCMALKNSVRKLLAEGEASYFYSPTEENVNGHVIIDGLDYWLKARDLTDHWANHYWARIKRPIVGFKSVNSDGSSIWPARGEKTVFSVGKTYSVTENDMLSNPGKGYFFSPKIEKALNYGKEDRRVFLVVASGLLFVKNSWDDLCSSTLTIIRELTKDEIHLLWPVVESPKAYWNGQNWSSNDEDLLFKYIINR